LKTFSPQNPVCIVLFAQVLLAWLQLRGIGVLFERRFQEGSLLILQRKSPELPRQLGESLNAGAEVVPTQLKPILYHASYRIGKNGEIAQRSRRGLDERLDCASESAKTINSSTTRSDVSHTEL